MALGQDQAKRLVFHLAIVVTLGDEVEQLVFLVLRGEDG